MAFFGAGLRPFRSSGLASLLSLAIAAALLTAGKEAIRYIRTETLSGAVDVVDGDSLRLGGDNIRLEGIDAPELHQTCWRDDAEAPCGRMARAALFALVRGGQVSCRSSGRDRYGRRLATCKAGDLDINRAMVLGGHAVAYGAYEAEQEQARRARRGLWAMRFDAPADWRARHPRPQSP